MGRIKTSDIKKTASRLMENNKGVFKPDFENTKDALRDMNFRQTKRVRNKIAGYITKKTKGEASTA
jgi:small subunit ribosomal protein S17e